MLKKFIMEYYRVVQSQFLVVIDIWLSSFLRLESAKQQQQQLMNYDFKFVSILKYIRNEINIGYMYNICYFYFLKYSLKNKFDISENNYNVHVLCCLLYLDSSIFYFYNCHSLFKDHDKLVKI